MSREEEEEINKQIAEKLAKAEALIKSCESLADEPSLSFHWDLEYGMGGYYEGSEAEWHPSSQSC